MHPQSPPLTIGGTVLNESDGLVILGVPFDYKMTFEKHLRSVYRAASQILGILGKSWRMFHDSVFECDIVHRQSVAVLCMLYKIRCNPMHPLNGALPGNYVTVRLTRGALVVHRYTYARPRCRTSQYRRTFVPLSVSFWNDLADPVFDGVGLAGFKRLYPYNSLLLFFSFSSSCL